MDPLIYWSIFYALPLFAQRTYLLKYMGKTSSNHTDYQYFHDLCTPYIRNVLPKIVLMTVDWWTEMEF